MNACPAPRDPEFEIGEEVLCQESPTCLSLNCWRVSGIYPGTLGEDNPDEVTRFCWMYGLIRLRAQEEKEVGSTLDVLYTSPSLRDVLTGFARNPNAAVTAAFVPETQLVSRAYLSEWWEAAHRDHGKYPKSADPQPKIPMSTLVDYHHPENTPRGVVTGIEVRLPRPSDGDELNYRYLMQPLAEGTRAMWLEERDLHHVSVEEIRREQELETEQRQLLTDAKALQVRLKSLKHQGIDLGVSLSVREGG